ncbi:MAG: MBL fold metallo-hydrolase [Firmicutes bacterium]|nr:MBL fold metallo-hydrolase [Bacillota bacterium]
MKLTVLGRYGPYPAAGGACSGYLLEEEGCPVLLDCGNGVLSRLQEHLKPWALEAVLLSHLHFDHIADLMVLRYALDYARSRDLRPHPLPLYALPKPAAEFERLLYKGLFKAVPLSGGEKLTVGPFNFSFIETIHSVPCLAMRIETEKGVLVYAVDTEYFDGLVNFAAGADILLTEASFLEKDTRRSPVNHLTAADAARLASRAGVNRLLLTHFHPERSPDASLEEAREYFAAAELAREGQTYRISG